MCFLLSQRKESLVENLTQARTALAQMAAAPPGKHTKEKRKPHPFFTFLAVNVDDDSPRQARDTRARTKINSKRSRNKYCVSLLAGTPRIRELRSHVSDDTDDEPPPQAPPSLVRPETENRFVSHFCFKRKTINMPRQTRDTQPHGKSSGNYKMFSLYRCRRFSRVCSRRPLPRLRRGRAATTSGCWRCSAPRRPRPPPRRQPGAAAAAAEKTARRPDSQHVRSSSCRVAAPAAAVAAAATWQPPRRRYPGGGRRRWGAGSRGGFTSALRWRSRPPADGSVARIAAEAAEAFATAALWRWPPGTCANAVLTAAGTRGDQGSGDGSGRRTCFSLRLSLLSRTSASGPYL